MKIRARFRLFLPCVAILVVGCASTVSDPPVADISSLDPDVADLLLDLTARTIEDPRDAGARGRLGLAYEAQGLLESARVAYEQAAGLDDAEPRWHYHLARLHAARGNLKGALERMGRALERAPDYAPAHWRAGQWHLELDEPVLAESAFRRALVHEPDAMAAHVGLARVYLADDRADEALSVLLASVQVHEANPYLHQLLGTAYRRLGRMDEARAALGLARPVTPSWDDPWRDEQLTYKIGFAADLKRAMTLLAARDHGRAIPILERLRQERPDDVTLLNNLGAAYLDVGRVDESKQALMAALGHDPMHFASHLNLGAVFERTGQWDLALSHLERAVAANPFLARAHEQRGTLLAGQRRFDEALTALETARRLQPGKASIAVRCGGVRLALRQFEHAARDFQEAVDREPTNREALKGLERALAESGDPIGARRVRDATAALDSGIQRNPH